MPYRAVSAGPRAGMLSNSSCMSHSWTWPHAARERGGTAVTFHLFLQPARESVGILWSPATSVKALAWIKKGKERQTMENHNLFSLCVLEQWIQGRVKPWIKWLLSHPCQDNCYKYLELIHCAWKVQMWQQGTCRNKFHWWVLLISVITQSTHKHEHRCTNCSCCMFAFAVLPRFGYHHHPCGVNVCTVVCLSSWVAKHLVNV